MNQYLLGQLKRMYSLKNIIRYNNIPRVTHETVAEHSYFVAMIVRELWWKYSFNKEKAIEMALIHDQNEIYLGDIVSTAKAEFSAVKKSIESAEDTISKVYFSSDRNLYKELKAKKTIESKIVKLADLYSVIQYTSNELLLGSNPDMKKIRNSVQKKITLLETELSTVERYLPIVLV